MTISYRMLLRGAKEIVTVTSSPEIGVLKGADMKQVEVLRGNAGFSLLIDDKGKISMVGTDADVDSKIGDSIVNTTLDVTGMVLMPGLVDAHTHPVWAGDRVHEFSMKLAGATYMDVHKAGGGIHFTVEKTRNASEEELWHSFKARAERMNKCGTTLLEAKSGYGLETETELKMLRVLEKGCADLPGIEISGTFCGAHAVPKGKTAEEATNDVIRTQLPALKSDIGLGKLNCVENIDVFCEQGVFSTEQTKKILVEGLHCGLAINFHGDELHPTKSAELAGELNARAVSHLEEISADGVAALSQSGTVAVLLPTTAYMLRLKPPPARRLIDGGVAVALGTDFNPNAYCYSMAMVMHLACVLFHMSMEESLAAATINAAASLGRGRTHGALSEGRVGDVVIVSAPRWEHFVYQFGAHSELIRGVVKAGRVVYWQKTDGAF